MHKDIHVPAEAISVQSTFLNWAGIDEKNDVYFNEWINFKIRNSDISYFVVKLSSF